DPVPQRANRSPASRRRQPVPPCLRQLLLHQHFALFTPGNRNNQTV
ncbi:FIG01047240: hypothetical protein, partial [Salmonella enterica subsp. enterica serovar Rissen]